MGLRVMELFFVALVICQSSGALGQSPGVFVYGESFSDTWLQVGDNPQTNINIDVIQNSDITCQGSLQPFSRSPLAGILSLSTSGSSTANVSGSCLYNEPLQLLQQPDENLVNSFGTMFQLTIDFPAEPVVIKNSSNSQNETVSDSGLAFIMVASDNSTLGGGGVDYLGQLNPTTNDHFLAVNIKFPLEDPYHVGIDVIQSGASIAYDTADWGWNAIDQQLQSGSSATFGVWVQYDGSSQILEVFLSRPQIRDESNTLPNKLPYNSAIYSKPTEPILSTTQSLNNIFSGFSASGLSGVYVGFLGSISLNSSGSMTFYRDIQYLISLWTFNSDGLAPDVLRDSHGFLTGIPDHKAQRKHHILRIITIGAVTIPTILLFLTFIYIITLLYWRNTRLTTLTKIYDIDVSVLNRGGCNFKYKALSTATKGFSPSELLGSGGFGSVYKGKLLLKGDEKPTEVAVKRISATSDQGAQEFLAEVKIIGQAQHRNLVRLLGWCHERGELLLVYDYMSNGSVDQHLFKNTDDAPGESTLTWSRRLKIVGGVAAALTYLHEEWEKLVIHRDLKCSNIMLDRDFNARLGDFGLARLYEHDKAPGTTIIAGTHGYMAPELFHTLKATEKTDVYSFGAVVLEVATGKKPILSVKDRAMSDHVLLVDWVWDLFENDALLDAADRRLENAYDRGEMVMFLKIGLLCSHPDPNERPCMREVVNIWKGLIPFPRVPQSKPIPTYAMAMNVQAGLNSSFLDSADHSTIALPSLDDSDPLTTQKPQEQSGDLNPASRYRPSSSASLPF